MESTYRERSCDTEVPQILSGRSGLTSAARYVLGISAFYHDSAACILRDGEIVAAAQEERFTRKKGDEAFPSGAVDYCLREAGVASPDLSAVAFYDKPLLKFERLLETYIGIAPRGFASFRKAAPLWMKERLYTERALRDGLHGYTGRLLYAEHHESHAASAFFPSPFEEAAILTIDGVGEWATATMGTGRGNEIDLTRELRWPDSLGLLYSAFTYHAGFRVNSGEYKIMGLAPYGSPKYVDRILEHVVELREDGSFTLDQRYFDYLGGLTMTSAAFGELFDGPPRVPESNLTQREMDLARSIQDVCELIVLRMARAARKETGLDCICLAGGVALNAVANGKLLRERIFRKHWIQPASGDAGGALGCAQLAWHRYLVGPRGMPSTGDGMKRARLGPEFSAAESRDALQSEGAVLEETDEDELTARVAELLADGAVVGWFDGRMEFGPRSLGGRSILADPRNPRMQAVINLKIKFREGFRPFAPSVLAEKCQDYFDLAEESPYMLLVAPVHEARRTAAEQTDGEELWGIDLLNIPRSDIPTVTHLDYSARIQTVTAENGRFFDLLTEFDRLTGCAVLVNTSFNVRGEPIVCTPEDAFRCFMRTGLDHLVVWPWLMSKTNQRPHSFKDDQWRTTLQAD